MPLAHYDTIRKLTRRNMLIPEVSGEFILLYQNALRYLDTLKRQEMISRVEGKRYFSFYNRGALSRPVNFDLFVENDELAKHFFSAISTSDCKGLTAGQINRICYSLTMSFACAVDIAGPGAGLSGGRKTPGTLFEKLVGYTLSQRLNVEPGRNIEIPVQIKNKNLKRIKLTTDLIYDLGHDLPKYHVPVKTSTRERIIDLWAHQRILDSAFGLGTYIGIPVLMTETKRDVKSLEIKEICQPDQLRLYQSHLSRISRLYYLDIPKAYENLNDGSPKIVVKSFGEFFFEANQIREVEQ